MSSLPGEEVLDALADGIVLVDARDTVRYMNVAVERVLRRGHDEIVGRSVWEAFPEALGVPFFLHYHRVRSEQAPAQFEAYYPSLDLWLEARLSPLVDGGVIADIWDMSPRKQAEAALRESEERFRATFDHAAVGMAHVAIDGQLLRINDDFCALLGRTRDDVLAHNIKDLTYPDDVAADVANVRRVVAGELDHYSMDKRYVRPDGSVVWGSLTGSLVRDHRGQPLYFIGVIEDITERKRLQTELAARAAQLQAIFDTITDAVFVFDAQGTIIEANAAARRQLPTDLDVYNALPRDARTSVYQPRSAEGSATTREAWPIAQLLRGEALNGNTAMDMTVSLHDGREHELSVTGAPIRSEDGEVIGAVGVTRDVTERRRLERQRIDILRTVSHDLGNPLGAAKLAIQTYHRYHQMFEELVDTAIMRALPQGVAQRVGQVSANIEHVVELLDDAIARMERLVGDLTTAIRLDKAGELMLQLSRFDLAALCQRSVRLTQGITKRVLVTDYSQAPVEVVGDPDAVGRVIANLLSNADKYSPIERPIALALRRDSQGRPRVEIIDQGPGIPVGERERIWEQFHQVPGIKARNAAGGLGLGLAICRGIIEQLGGEIGVESEEGAGSTFWFTLPLA